MADAPASEPRTCKLRILVLRPNGHFSEEEKAFAKEQGAAKFCEDRKDLAFGIQKVGTTYLQLVDEKGETATFWYTHGSVQIQEQLAQKHRERKIPVRALLSLALLSNPDRLQEMAKTTSEGKTRINPRYHDGIEYSLTRADYDANLAEFRSYTGGRYNEAFHNCADFALERIKKAGLTPPTLPRLCIVKSPMIMVGAIRRGYEKQRLAPEQIGHADGTPAFVPFIEHVRQLRQGKDDAVPNRK